MLHELALGFLALFILAVLSGPIAQVVAIVYVTGLTVLGVLVYPFFKLKELLDKSSK